MMNECANSIFEQPVWLDIVASGVWTESIVKESGEIIARLPYVVKNGNIRRPILTQTLGPWIAPKYRNCTKGNSQFGIQKEIIGELLSQLPKYRSFDMVFDSANSYIKPYLWKGFSVAPLFSYRINDLRNLDAVYANFGKTVLKNIKTARHKVHIVDSSDAEKMIYLLKQTFERKNKAFSNADELFTTNVITQALNNGIGKLLLSEDDNGNIHSGAFLIYDSRVCYYLLGGTNPKFKSGGAQSLVLWNAIQFAATVSEKFDFEGSMMESIETFFRQFGGDEVVNYHIMKYSKLYRVLRAGKSVTNRFLAGIFR